MTLEELAAWEDRLSAEVPERGFFEEREVWYAASKVPGEWRELLSAYIDLFSDQSKRPEAIKRALFLVWYMHAEPRLLTGLPEFEPTAVESVFAAVEEELQTSTADPELMLMLRLYGRHCEYAFPESIGPVTLRLIQQGASVSLTTNDFTAIAGRSQNRGSLGDYWRSIAHVT